MYNKIILVLLSFLITSTVFAEPLFFSPKNQPGTSGGLSNQVTVLSPTQFNEQVAQIAAQKQAAFTQEFNQRMIQLKAQAPSTSATSKNQPSQPTGSNSAAGSEASQNTPSSHPVAAAPPQNNNVYTGFGSSPSNTNTGSMQPSSPSSGQPRSSGSGWNMHY